MTSSHIHIVSHHIETDLGKRVHNNFRLLPRQLWKAVCKELQAMLDLRMAEESHRNWRSPIVHVSKSDETRRFCINFRSVNAVSKFDAYQMLPGR